MHKTDKMILFITIIIVAFSVLTLYSSCHQKGEFVLQSIFYRQIIWIIIGLFLSFVFYMIDYRKLWDFAWLLYVFTILALIVVLIFGRTRLGAQRWLELGGFNFQPSEFGKLAIILVLARYFSQKSFEELKIFKNRFSLARGFVFPLFVTGVLALLVLIQPDLGTAIIYFFIFMSLIFFVGVRIRYIIIFICSGLIASPFLWSLLRGYQRDRLLVFLNPSRDPLGAGYTIIQSKIAVGSGGLLGKGWLSGTQNQLNFLPERHTDFIFSTIGEEWGFFGSVVLIILFYVLVKRILMLSSLAHDPFAKNLCLCIASLIFIQSFINIAMTIGFMPVVGLPLPFISYGGSSLVSFLLLIGIVLNISKSL
ncbi:MAG: rod shape-determining protein RodA [Candidatus Omnitrophica bacterium]|nr:rod shape-determining protein RodA [Candidatus Omnitrophota bacterium]MDD5352748.1 rod shape-determining protein RodA [Candidatus Omnitrophota bacterium]MDD5550347.1 rod shape-determining protein RodA [Candidatus Omnitrophota bacterium]